MGVRIDPCGTPVVTVRCRKIVLFDLLLQNHPKPEICLWNQSLWPRDSNGTQKKLNRKIEKWPGHRWKTVRTEYLSQNWWAALLFAFLSDQNKKSECQEVTQLWLYVNFLTDTTCSSCCISVNQWAVAGLWPTGQQDNIKLLPYLPFYIMWFTLAFFRDINVFQSTFELILVFIWWARVVGIVFCMYVAYRTEKVFSCVTMHF